MRDEPVPDTGLSSNASGDRIDFSSLDNESGLLITDRIERREYPLSTPTSVTPKAVDTDRIPAPVDAAVRATTSAVTLPHREAVNVRDESGMPVMQTYDTVESCPPNRYLVQITGQIKLYLSVEAPVRVTPTSSATTIGFDDPTEVLIGARSPHRSPGGTITTTDDLDQIRAAVSALSSALKTTSSERSYPTLRGHPPRLELGQEWSRPDHLVAPETGVTLEIHRSLEDVLVAAPLAFYLGAELAWGDRRIITDSGFVNSLSDRQDFETGVERGLKQTFLLDCLTRTEGLYPVELDERRVFENLSDVQLDFARLYDLSLSQRLEAYLRVPYESVADLVPTWSASTYVQPAPETVSYLPYLLDDLSIIRTTGHERLEKKDKDRRVATANGPGSRSVETAERPSDVGPHLVLPESETAVSRLWVGDGIPIGAPKALASGFEHRLEREPRTHDIRIEVVCNESEMGEERDAVHDVYSERREHSFDLNVRRDASTDRLRAAIEQDADFFHFIGHIDGRGFRCSDGWLSAADCAEVGADVFFLNTCRSYEVGEAMVRNGSIAGIVTVTDLLNHRAAAIGETIATFLNYGFPLYAALDVVRDTYRFGDAYTILGNARTVLFQPTTPFPEYLELRSRVGDTVTVAHRTFPSNWAGIGSALCPPYEAGDRHYLFGGEIGVTEMSVEELDSLLDQPTPLRDGGDLRFSVTTDLGDET